MDEGENFSVGTIGGAESFAGQTTAILRARHGWLGAPAYYPTGAAMFAALAAGEVDAAIGAGANLGEGPTVMASLLSAPDSLYYLVAEAALPFGALLLGAAGARLEDIRIVYGGHASLALARSFMARALPGAEAAGYTDPLATAAEVAAAGGSAAVLGTRGLAERFGLDVLAEDVDGGAVNGLWWVIANRPRFAPAPTRLCVALRAGDDGRLGELMGALAQTGMVLASAWPRPTGVALVEADYLLRFRGAAAIEAARAAIARCPGARLAGALAGEG